MSEQRKLESKVIRCGTLIDGTGAEPVKDAVVVIEGSKIKAVGKRLSMPRGAEVIDATHKTVMPGLIDAHLHLWGLNTGAEIEKIVRPAGLRLIKSISSAKTLLAAGYTTVKDCGGSINAVFLKKAVEEGILAGVPRILAAGYFLTQTLGHGDYHYLPIDCVDVRTSRHQGLCGSHALICDGVDECIKATRYALREGADFIKVCTTGGLASERDKPSDVQFNLNEIRAIVETAAQANKFVTAHYQASLKALKQSILGGIKTIDHAFLVDDECLDLARKNGVVFVSSLAILQRVLDHGEKLGRQPWEMEKIRAHRHMASESYKKILKAGAPFAAGTDFMDSPLSKFGTNAEELEYLVKECDFSPMDAVVAATKHAAAACFMEDKTGTIEPEKFADIIIVDGNPLTNIKILQDLDKIRMVMLEGRVEVRR